MFKPHYFDKIRGMVDKMVANELTVGFEDVGLTPYSDEQVAKFLQNNGREFDNAILDMVNDYANDDELEVLEDPCFDWILEYINKTPCMSEIIDQRENCLEEFDEIMEVAHAILKEELNFGDKEIDQNQDEIDECVRTMINEQEYEEQMMNWTNVNRIRKYLVKAPFMQDDSIQEKMRNFDRIKETVIHILHSESEKDQNNTITIDCETCDPITVDCVDLFLSTNQKLLDDYIKQMVLEQMENPDQNRLHSRAIQLYKGICNKEIKEEQLWN